MEIRWQCLARLSKSMYQFVECYSLRRIIKGCRYTGVYRIGSRVFQAAICLLWLCKKGYCSPRLALSSMWTARLWLHLRLPVNTPGCGHIVQAWAATNTEARAIPTENCIVCLDLRWLKCLWFLLISLLNYWSEDSNCTEIFPPLSSASTEEYLSDKSAVVNLIIYLRLSFYFKGSHALRLYREPAEGALSLSRIARARIGHPKRANSH